jgi:predicted ATPase
MITHFEFKNFKSWADSGRIRLAPITVFFGTNSSGKSSIGQLLLLLKQTAESSDRSRVLDTGDRDTEVEVGSFRDFIHHHETDRELEFEIGWRQSKPVEIRDTLNPTVRYRDDRLVFRAIVQKDDRKENQMQLKMFEYALGASERAQAPFSAGLERDPERGRYDAFFRGFDELRAQGRPRIPTPARFYGFPDEAVANYKNTEFLPNLSLALERLLDGVSYLGPLRLDPERVYIWAGGTPDSVGWSGERTIEALLAAGGRGYNFEPGYHLKSLQDVVAEQLRQLGLITSFTVTPVGPNRPEHEVRVVVPGAGDEVVLTDVGFGISQVLPVVVQSFYAPPDSTIIMEQPELHLHPRAQMELGDFFIQAHRAREGGVERKPQFLLESHSEHLLRRLQRRIAEDELSPDTVALYFCELVDGESRIRELDVDLFGNIHNWPKDFFGDPIEDVAAQTRYRLRREAQATGK